ASIGAGRCRGFIARQASALAASNIAIRGLRMRLIIDPVTMPAASTASALQEMVPPSEVALGVEASILLKNVNNKGLLVK
ncbi:MAG: hypothetical protein JWO89_2593, partial [Verrucomicrobiaceae bacterium]|nr:hypothetical protein [Verrucomicrobiaceae bacterium]